MADGKIYPDAPEGMRVLKNGAGMMDGKLVKGPGTYGPNVTGIQTSEDGRRLRQARTEKARAAAERGMIEAAEAVDKAHGYTAPDAVRVIIKRRAEIAINDDGHAGNQAAEFVLKTAGQLQQSNHSQSDGDNTLTLTLNDEAIQSIAQTLADAKKTPEGASPDIIDY